MKTGDMLLIHWIDSWVNSTSYYDEDYDYGPIFMTELGFFVKETDEGILTVRCLQSSPNDPTDINRFRGETFTPWDMIRKVEILT